MDHLAARVASTRRVSEKRTKRSSPEPSRQALRWSFSLRVRRPELYDDHPRHHPRVRNGSRRPDDVSEMRLAMKRTPASTEKSYPGTTASWSPGRSETRDRLRRAWINVSEITPMPHDRRITLTRPIGPNEVISREGSRRSQRFREKYG